MARKDNHTIELHIKGHDVTVRGNVVHVHHKKSCDTPCLGLKPVLEYLEAELFVVDGYVTNEVVEDE
jgi:hypothetical protein